MHHQSVAQDRHVGHCTGLLDTSTQTSILFLVYSLTVQTIGGFRRWNGCPLDYPLGKIKKNKRWDWISLKLNLTSNADNLLLLSQEYVLIIGLHGRCVVRDNSYWKGLPLPIDPRLYTSKSDLNTLMGRPKQDIATVSRIW